ncbi:MAG: gliding motility protein GldL [Muribaculaceae bacterium]|nr:gliding motility protein GldL [Muribaculaceae bacterium]
MTKIQKYRNSIEEFLHSDNGQRFFNIAYSVGAAIVIWGALFKILHLPGGNTLLCIGMGTEIAMFLLTAFDRPPKEPNWDEIVPALTGGRVGGPVEALEIEDDSQPYEQKELGGPSGYIGVPVEVNMGQTVGIPVGGTIGAAPGATVVDINAMTGDMVKATEELSQVGELAEATNRFTEAIEGISKQMSDLQESMATGTYGYAEQMTELNRNLAGLNTIYEIQLKSIAGQLEAIDRVNKGLKDIRDMYEKSAADSERYCEESEKMTKNMQRINEVYAKMIAALTINQPNS